MTQGGKKTRRRKKGHFCPTCASPLVRTSKQWFTCPHCPMKLVGKKDLKNYRLTATQRKLMNGLPFCSSAGCHGGVTVYLIEGLEGGYEFQATGAKPGFVHAVDTVGKIILSLKRIEQDRLAKLIFGAAA